jgi:hypothetical protein
MMAQGSRAVWVLRATRGTAGRRLRLVPGLCDEWLAGLAARRLWRSIISTPVCRSQWDGGDGSAEGQELAR